MLEEFGEKCDFEVDDAIQKMDKLGIVTKVRVILSLCHTMKLLHLVLVCCQTSLNRTPGHVCKRLGRNCVHGHLCSICILCFLRVTGLHRIHRADTHISRLGRQIKSLEHLETFRRSDSVV